MTQFPMTDDEILRFVEDLKTEKGENALSQMLQQRIQKTKKIESETASLTKKAEMEKKQTEALREESSKLLAKSRQLEAHCNALTKEISEWPDRKQRRDEEWKERMASVSGGVEKEANNLSEKLDSDDVAIKEKEAENILMRSSFDQLKAEFDEAFKAYEMGWKEREERTKETIAKLREFQQTNDILRAQGLMQEKHVQRLTETINAYSQQLEMYESRFSDVESSSMRSDEIKILADKQQQQIQDQIDAVEGSKKMDVDEKLRYDTEAQKLRSKFQQLKKKIVSTEKAKHLAEQKCRETQKRKK